MAGSVNKVILVGNLGQDPEIRSFQNGGKVANLRIATSETWKDRNSGERRERTEWHTIAIYSEPLVRVAEQFLKKGSKVYVEGQLETRKWQDQSGNDRYSTEVALRPFRSELHMTNDKDLFIEQPAVNLIPLYQGRMIWQFDHKYEKPEYWLNIDAFDERQRSKELHDRTLKCERQCRAHLQAPLVADAL